MADPSPLNRLLTVLRERRIPLTRDDVQWAFQSVKTQADIEAWVRQYLNPETLLSKEELDTYQQVSKKTSNKKTAKVPSDARPLQDEDFKAAIEALESSTAAIELQSKSLEIQKDALVALKKQNEGSNDKMQRREEERRKRIAQEKSQLDFDIEGLTEAIDERLTTAQKRTKSTMIDLSSTATERLNSDDRTLAALSTMAPKIDELPSSEVDIKSVEDWCSSVISFRAASIRARIDRIFQESLLTFDADECAEKSEEDLVAEKDALKGELEELYSEIASVTEMVVEHESRGPIRRMVKKSEDRQKYQQRRWLAYILSSLDYMTRRLDTVSTHAQDFGAYQTLLGEMGSLFREEKKLLSDLETAPSPDSKRSRAFSKPKLQDIEYSTATKQLFRHLDIAPPHGDHDQVHSNLARVTLESQNRLFEHLGTSQVSATQELAACIGESDAELRSILGALYANTEYKDVQLSNPELNSRLKRLDGGIAEASKMMVDLNSMLEPAVGEKRDELIERWG